jgi:hypothetical protein
LFFSLKEGLIRFTFWFVGSFVLSFLHISSSSLFVQETNIGRGAHKSIDIEKGKKIEILLQLFSSSDKKRKKVQYRITRQYSNAFEEREREREREREKEKLLHYHKER